MLGLVTSARAFKDALDSAPGRAALTALDGGRLEPLELPLTLLGHD